jgi:hypothetical protein
MGRSAQNGPCLSLQVTLLFSSFPPPPPLPTHTHTHTPTHTLTPPLSPQVLARAVCAHQRCLPRRAARGLHRLGAAAVHPAGPPAALFVPDHRVGPWEGGEGRGHGDEGLKRVWGGSGEKILSTSGRRLGGSPARLSLLSLLFISLSLSHTHTHTHISLTHMLLPHAL